MKIIRRLHLYSGLFMFPWVLLYGVTGMFFNHPHAFTGGEVRTFQLNSVADGRLADLPTPEGMAADLVAAVNAATGQATVAITDRRAPQFSRTLTYTVDAGAVRHTVTVDPVSGAGEVRTHSAPAAAEPPEDLLAEVRPVAPSRNPLVETEAALPRILEDMGLPGGAVSRDRRQPILTFSADINGQPHVVTFDLANGTLAGAPETKELDIDARSFLQRLHLSRGYAPHWGIASLWGVLVDLMFVSMVFWACSGLLMWWQIKRTRLWGVGCVLLSAAVTVLLVAGMHDQLTFATTQPAPAAAKTARPAAPAAKSSMPRA